MEYLNYALAFLSSSIQTLIYVTICLVIIVLIGSILLHFLKVILERLISIYFYCSLHAALKRCAMEKKLADEKVKGYRA